MTNCSLCHKPLGSNAEILLFVGALTKLAICQYCMFGVIHDLEKRGLINNEK